MLGSAALGGSEINQRGQQTGGQSQAFPFSSQRSPGLGPSVAELSGIDMLDPIGGGGLGGGGGGAMGSMNAANQYGAGGGARSGGFSNGSLNGGDNNNGKNNSNSANDLPDFFGEGSFFNFGDG